jgi:lysophospholipase L1-like esterase
VSPRPARPEQPEPFLRGCRFAAAPGVPYPRADGRDFTRLPIDTWGTAQVPATVRLELVGDAEAVEIAYRTETEDLGYRGDGAGTTFALWRDGAQVAEEKAVLGEGAVRLAMRAPGLDATGERAIVYLPEGMRPTVLSIDGVGGTVEPAPPQHRWVAYGDSIAEGWVASGPSGAWPAIAGRTHRLDVCNMGYAGSARGEIVSAEHVAALDADVISITHGTNCWTRIPFSVEMMRAGTAAFIDVVRQGHAETPIVVASPVVRPDAEATPNRLGATLADLRAVMEEVAQARVDAGDKRLTLVPGGDIIGAELLADGIHPGDEGHRVLAEVIGGAVRDALDRS